MTASPDRPCATAEGTDPVFDLSSAPPTEQRNPRTTDIDLRPTPVVLALLHAEDALVPAAVQPVLGTLAELVDEAAERIRGGGRVHYFGAGSSGRIAVLDATELVPTFGLARGIVTAHLAGGDDAMERAVEGAEDDVASGGADAASVTAADLVIGLSASGRTPYVAGALAASVTGYAVAFGELTVTARASDILDPSRGDPAAILDVSRHRLGLEAERLLVVGRGAGVKSGTHGLALPGQKTPSNRGGQTPCFTAT